MRGNEQASVAFRGNRRCEILELSVYSPEVGRRALGHPTIRGSGFTVLVSLTDDSFSGEDAPPTSFQ